MFGQESATDGWSAPAFISKISYRSNFAYEKLLLPEFDDSVYSTDSYLSLRSVIELFSPLQIEEIHAPMCIVSSEV